MQGKDSRFKLAKQSGLTSWHHDQFEIPLSKAYNAVGIKNKLNVLLMGPGFNQVQPQYRLGDPTKIPAIDSKYEVYNPNVSTAMKIYAFIIGTHANILFEAAQVYIYITHLTETPILQLWAGVETIDKLIVIGYFIYSGSAAARLFKGCSSANVLELVRYSILIPFLLSRNLFGTGVMNMYTQVQFGGIF